VTADTVGGKSEGRTDMGWMWTNRPKGVSDMEWFGSPEYEGHPKDSGYRLLATARDGFTAVYGALEIPGGDVVGVVWLTGYAPNDYYNFGTKGMSEDMGPGETRCPERILDMLTPTDSEWAQQWRAACRAYHAARKARPSITKGAKIRVKELAQYGVLTVLDGKRGIVETERGYRLRVSWLRRATVETA